MGGREQGKGWRGRGGEGEGGTEGMREAGREVREGGREGGEGARREAMMLCRERASVEEERVEGGRIDEGNERGRDGTGHGRREGKRGGREHGSKGERETSREVVYSQTNHSQTGPCP